MPDTTYPIGTNKLTYKSEDFAAGIDVTVRMFDVDLQEVDGSPFTLAELGYGLYYFEYNFTEYSIYHAVFFEGIASTLYHTYRVRLRA